MNSFTKSASPIYTPSIVGQFSTSKGCLFCGQTWEKEKKSFEHVLPQWMRKHEQELLKSSHHSYSLGLDLDTDSRELVELPSTLVMRKSSLLTLKTREVCATCNSGWMSKLEQEARPPILQIADAARSGEDVKISRVNALTLALWCQKTAATNELTSAGPHVMTAQMARQLSARKPLRGSLVWAARHPRDYDLGLARVHMNLSSTFFPARDDPTRQISLTAIVYHWVTFLVFIADSPGQIPPPLPLDRWTLLWPRASDVDYPPLALTNGKQLTETLTNQSWVPTVAVSGFRPSPVPLRVQQRN